MRKQIEQVSKFQQAFKSLYNTEPTNINFDDYLLRFKLLKEENEEYLEACEQDDMVEIVDALGDQLFIVLGSIISHGAQHIIEDVFTEIYESNMSKLGEDGEPIINGVNGYDEKKPLGKILKSNRYFEPNIEMFL